MRCVPVNYLSDVNCSLKCEKLTLQIRRVYRGSQNVASEEGAQNIKKAANLQSFTRETECELMCEFRFLKTEIHTYADIRYGVGSQE